MLIFIGRMIPPESEGGLGMKRTIHLLVAVLAFALVATACGGGDDAGDLNLVTAGTLTICVDAPYPPMEFELNGEYTGFDVELMRAIADDLGLDLAVNNTGFDPITSGLAMEAGDCDIAASSITITEDREKNIDFSDPYFTADQSLLVTKASGLSSLADLAGHNIGVQTGTTGEIYANENNPGAEIISFENPGDLFTALAAGQIDGVLQDIIPNADAALNDDTVQIVETFPTAEQYGFATKEEGAEDVLAAVNKSLKKLRDNGTYDSIYADWF
jgi:ABC-type amino acid transport substrate-binding protein